MASRDGWDHTTLRREQLDDNGMGRLKSILSGRISLSTVSSTKVTGFSELPSGER
jgi:hypothetical protein